MNDDDGELDITALEPFDPTEFDAPEVATSDTLASAVGDIPELDGIDLAEIAELPIVTTTTT